MIWGQLGGGLGDVNRFWGVITNGGSIAIVMGDFPGFMLLLVDVYLIGHGV